MDWWDYFSGTGSGIGKGYILKIIFSINKTNSMVKQQMKKALFLSTLLIVGFVVSGQAQAIATGLDGAANEVKGIFGNVSNLILMVGGIIGLAGGIRVYQKWNNGDHDINKELIGWGGSAIFLLLAGTTLKLFYGI
jgi:hypothetical protein